jgi:hypothetical protein
MNEADIVFESGDCAICGYPTLQTIVPGHQKLREERGAKDREPFVCNKCLLDLRGDMATELEVRRQLGNLEAKVEGLSTRQWFLYLAFTLAVGLLSFLAGQLFGGSPGP